MRWNRRSGPYGGWQNEREETESHNNFFYNDSGHGDGEALYEKRSPRTPDTGAAGDYRRLRYGMGGTAGKPRAPFTEDGRKWAEMGRYDRAGSVGKSVSVQGMPDLGNDDIVFLFFLHGPDHGSGKSLLFSLTAEKLRFLL